MEIPPPYHVGPTDSAEPPLTTEDLVAHAHAQRQGIPYETGEQWLERLPERLRALADLILSGKMNAGDPSAQFAMAEYHVSDEDPTVMLRWLRASACQGYPLAQVSLGVLYDAGDSVPQDRISAYIWFSEAAQGEGDAVEMAADLNAAMADDERAFAQGLIRQGRSALIDCRIH